MFFSVHNTKRFDRTDKYGALESFHTTWACAMKSSKSFELRLLTILARCSDPGFVNESKCSSSDPQMISDVLRLHCSCQESQGLATSLPNGESEGGRGWRMYSHVQPGAMSGYDII